MGKTKDETALAVARPEPPTLPAKIEAALVEGDLKGLSSEERAKFYAMTCESLGLNPLTKPFGYIVLNGKLTLYALKGCTDQLRDVHGISITELREEMQGDLYCVWATARDKHGRTDCDLGAVPIKSLGGEALANARMKAVTKAKRRVTLSLCGLGMLDETEVVTIPGAQITDGDAPPVLRRPKAVDTPPKAAAEEPGDDVPDEAGVVFDEPNDATPWPKERRQFKNMPLVTHAEFKKLMATLRERVGKNADEQLIAKLTECGIHHRDEIPHISLPRLMEWAKGEPERKAHAKIVRKR